MFLQNRSQKQYRTTHPPRREMNALSTGINHRVLENLQRTSYEMIENLAAADLVLEREGARRRSQSYGEHVRRRSRAKDQG